jgi:hypothetical protein
MDKEQQAKAESNRAFVIQAKDSLIEQQRQVIESLTTLVENMRTAPVAVAEPEGELKTVQVIQINANGKKYFCTTDQEERAFYKNNPGAVSETHKIGLPRDVAEKYLDDPENQKAFRPSADGSSKPTGILGGTDEPPKPVPEPQQSLTPGQWAELNKKREKKTVKNEYPRI